MPAGPGSRDTDPTVHPVQRRAPLKRTGRLNPRSKKRAQLYREQRAPLVAQLLSSNPPCQRCHTRPATDVHELKSRARGGSITDLSNLSLLCRPCHTWITTHPADATAEGFLLPSWHQGEGGHED